MYGPHEVNLLSAVCNKGKPSATRVKELAQCHRAGRSSGEGKDFSLLAIRIRTGRRHQIRTHMLHAGHPVVCDGKYTTSVAFERAWCERSFLHRYRSAFADRVGRTHEAVAPSPGDRRVPKMTWLGQKKRQPFQGIEKNLIVVMLVTIHDSCREPPPQGSGRIPRAPGQFPLPPVTLSETSLDVPKTPGRIRPLPASRCS